MTDRELKLVTAALLHDIGKIVYRAGDGRKHSISGYDLLKEEAKISDKEVLDAVRFHHGSALVEANIDDNALAYIVYIADNIAAASDRRNTNDEEYGFSQEIPLQSIFNILNRNNKKYHYRPTSLDNEEDINMPIETGVQFDKSFYLKIKTEILDALKGIENWNEKYINSLLATMEAYLSYIPSSTALHELTDISLYDHVKMTAAYSHCIYQYLKDKEIKNYKEILFERANDFYKEKAFRLFSMDISGIQKFIYTIHSKGALRMLRSRSFYLEIMMEHMVDELLETCELTRANLIYSGGGHCYILLPNTDATIEKIAKVEREFNGFFLKHFDISLYVAMASVECSAEDLENRPLGSYAEIFRKLSKLLAKQKSHRYSAEQIIFLNNENRKGEIRECKICKNSTNVGEEGVCELCENLSRFSTDILYKDFFTVIQEKREHSIPLPGNRYLISQNKEEVKNSMIADDYFIRTYGKNEFFTGQSVATKLWVGDYTQKGMTTEDYAKAAMGIDRIAVLRADVDNLGQAFVEGFPEKYTTLSRTATFSRQLSMFFKRHINFILKDGEYGMINKPTKRKATIVYSGGDDLFIVGSWNDVIELAVDIQQKLEEYTIGTLTISAGIGIYPAKYPLNVSANEVEKLEEQSKNYLNKENQLKNAVTVFNDTYSWKEFKEEVVGEKLFALEEFFGTSEERGKAFLYRLLDLIRNMDDKINLARFAYVLSRLEPTEGKEKEEYKKFSKQMFQWVQKSEDKRQLVTAIYIYVYLYREGGTD